MRASRRTERPGCLPNGEGSESDPRLFDKGSSAGPTASDFVAGREELIEAAIALFGPRYRHEISRDEAGRMVDRLTAFFGLLADWDRRAGGEDAQRANAA